LSPYLANIQIVLFVNSYLGMRGAEAPDYAKRSIEPQPKDRGNKTQNNQPIEEKLYFFNRTVMILL